MKILTHKLLSTLKCAKRFSHLKTALKWRMTLLKMELEQNSGGYSMKVRPPLLVSSTDGSLQKDQVTLQWTS